MKRHQKLLELSREHHSALQLALKAKRAAMSGEQAILETAAAACVAAFFSALDPHFVIEESTLLPLLVGAGQDRLVKQFEHDHQELRRLALQLEQADAAILLCFAELLISHVRFEEREMFVALEAHLAV